MKTQINKKNWRSVHKSCSYTYDNKSFLVL